MGFLIDTIPKINTHTADLDAHTKNFFEEPQTGGYWRAWWAPSGTKALSANQLWAIRYPIVRDMTIKYISIQITTAMSANNKARLGIYADNGAYYPGTLLKDAGEVDGDAVARVVATADYATSKGYIWLALLLQADVTVKGLSQTVGTAKLYAPSYSYYHFDSFRKAGVTYEELPSTFPSGGTQDESSTTIPGIYPYIESLD